MEFNENLIKFGWLTKADMFTAISNGSLGKYNICFCKDTKEQYLIDENLSPISIKSRVKVFQSAEIALNEIQNDTSVYSGELISVKDNDKFIAYIVNEIDGNFTIEPISKKSLDYDKISNIPIKNLDGSVSTPIILKNLNSGYYKITGHFITPDNIEITSYVGNMIYIEKSSDKILIKRININSIYDYFIDSSGNVTQDKYLTENYLREKGVVTLQDIDEKLKTLDYINRDELEKYINETFDSIIKQAVKDELDERYCSSEDIQNLFK